jgi:hypothetical protein
MHFKNNIIKVAALIAAAFFLFSFTTIYVLSVKDWKKIEKNAKAVFNIEELSFFEIRNISVFEATRLYKINDLGYLAFDQAPSKFHKFEYYIIFDKKGEILKVEVLNYNENYGAEICNKRWLKQFYQINTSSFFEYNTTIDGISGATISVQSISTHIWNVTEELKNYLKQE